MPSATARRAYQQRERERMAADPEFAAAVRAKRAAYRREYMRRRMASDPAFAERVRVRSLERHHERVATDPQYVEHRRELDRRASRRQSPEYRAYKGARTRCTNPNVHGWEHYGGRGIEFRFESFEQFLEAVGRRPTRRHSLDRIDVNGHYEPGNVRWATPRQQSRNRRPRSEWRNANTTGGAS